MGIFKRDIHVHINFHDNSHKLREILKKLNIMPTKAEFDAAFQELRTTLTNISEDITRLTDGLSSGNLTDEQEADTFTQLRAIADQAKAMADRTPEAQG